MFTQSPSRQRQSGTAVSCHCQLKQYLVEKLGLVQKNQQPPPSNLASLRWARPQSPTECAAQTLKTLIKNNPLRNKKPLYQPAAPGLLIVQVTCGTWAHSPQNPVGCVFISNSQVAKISRSSNKASSRQNTALIKKGASEQDSQVPTLPTPPQRKPDQRHGLWMVYLLCLSCAPFIA